MAADASRPGAGRLLAWLWRAYLRRHLGKVLIALVLMSIEGSMLGALSYSVRPMFDSFFADGRPLAVLTVAGLVFLVFLARALAGFGQRALMARVGQEVGMRMQADLVDHLLTLDPLWFQRNPPGRLIEQVRGDTMAAVSLWSAVLAAGGRDAIALISLAAVAISIDPLWTLIAVAGVPLLILPVFLLQRLVRRTSARARHAAGLISTRLDEIFHGIEAIRLDRLAARERARFAAALEKMRRASVISATATAGIPALTDIVAGLGFMAVLAVGGFAVADGEKSVGEFMSFFAAMALVFDPLRRLGNVTGAWASARASLERVQALHDEQPTILPPARPLPLPVPATEADIVLSDVRVDFEGVPALDGLSMVAPAGRVTAVVGPSGAGKTTVLRLITRLIEPQAGAVTLAGVPVSRLAPETLTDSIAVVGQEARLFDDSLRENILLGRALSEARLEEILRAAHVADLVATLPEGLETQVGPRGSNLSGGQRQRVAIARALAKDAPILLLDEATSALDAESERTVQGALTRLRAGRTTLVIAHRLATVQSADRICVLDRGRLVEEGTHETLRARGGLYAGLCRLQFADP